MKAWELLSDKSKWCKNVMRKYSGGKVTQWCVMGAIFDVYQPTESVDMLRKLRDSIQKDLGFLVIFDWNDSSTFEQVHAKLKELDI